MALPLMKIYTAIKDDYPNLKLERDWIEIPLMEDPDIELVVTPYRVTIRFDILNRLEIPHENKEDLVGIQNSITHAIVFIRDFIKEILEHQKRFNSKLLEEGNTIWVKGRI